MLINIISALYLISYYIFIYVNIILTNYNDNNILLIWAILNKYIYILRYYFY